MRSLDNAHIPQYTPFDIVAATSQAPWKRQSFAGRVAPAVDWPFASVHPTPSALLNTAPTDSPTTKNLYK